MDVTLVAAFVVQAKVGGSAKRLSW